MRTRMADKATASGRPEGTRTKKLDSQAQDAIAESLAELKRDAPERTSRKRAVAPKVSTDDLFNSIAPREEAAEAKQADPKPDGAPKKEATTKKTTKKKAGEALFSASDAQSGSGAKAAESALAPAMTALLFQEPDVAQARTRRRPPSKNNEPSEPSEASHKQSNGDSKDESKGNRRGSRGRRKQGETTEDSDNQRETAPEAESAQEKSGAKDGGQKDSKGNRDTRSKKDSKDKDHGKDQPAKGQPNKDQTNKDQPAKEQAKDADKEEADQSVTTRRRRRRRSSEATDEVTAPKGSTRLEAKRQRRKEGREAG
ncbi:MAG: hypothetical protein ACTHW1_06055, partial [Ancrocorticia sp.]